MENPVVLEGIVRRTQSTGQMNGNACQTSECRGVSDLCAGQQKFITLASIVSFPVLFGFFGFI